ncbi:MAG: efflux RND transporter periplasmic adaptor subunit [Flavobacteriales bacterium]|nr:efflux RND transporter periplasmic adaptor subunit [Flavobacteriales bacterium]
MIANRLILSPYHLLLALLFMSCGSEGDVDIKARAERGDLDIVVAVTGEIEAKESTMIMGPEGMRQARIWQVKITDLVPEGTFVKEGEYVATLDRNEVATKMKESQTELEKVQAQLTQAKLDTALDLRQARDNLVNLKFGLEQKQLTLDQSTYEPPAVIRDAEIELEKAQRGYEQAKENYEIKVKQARAKVSEVNATYQQTLNNFEFLEEFISEFVVNAPHDGMVIYHRLWNGAKQKVGATVHAWEPVVATLPDLSTLVSRTYVNEIDIGKIKSGQKVKVAMDAFPDREYEGEVIEVANVGEQRANSDAKEFEVLIELLHTDTLLRPAMTSSNLIQIESLQDVLYIPIEAVHSNDSITFVFMGGGPVKHQVKTGMDDGSFIEITSGLEEGDEIWLNSPSDAEKLSIEYLNED